MPTQAPAAEHPQAGDPAPEAPVGPISASRGRLSSLSAWLPLGWRGTALVAAAVTLLNWPGWSQVKPGLDISWQAGLALAFTRARALGWRVADRKGLHNGRLFRGCHGARLGEAPSLVMGRRSLY